MTHPLLTRPHLEATLVALAVVRPERRRELLAGVDRDRVSVAAWKLLDQLATDDDEMIDVRTDAQRALAARVEEITVGDLLYWPVPTLLALVNQLPERASREQAWERDLVVARGAA